MGEEPKKETPEWLGCPSSVKSALPKKIQNAVKYALDESFLELVGTPEAQRNGWVYKEIKAKITEAMKQWIQEAMDDAIAEALK